MASYSRRSRSAGSHGSTCGSMMVGASAAPPNMSFCPMVAASWLRWHAARIASAPANTRARLESSASNAPAAARLSITRLLIARGLTRAAKSASEVNSPSLRASTISSTAWWPTPFSAGQRVVDGAVADFEGGAGTVDRGRLDLDPEPLRLGAKLADSLSVLLMSSVIDAARNSTG